MHAHGREYKSMRWLALLLAGAVIAPLHAQDATASNALGTPVAFDRLESMRGGFDLPSGLQASFGFERVVYLNGELMATTRVHIPDISAITPEQAQALAAARQTTLVQVGEGNTFQASSMAGGLVIQNTLDGQDILVLTTLDAGVGTLGQFQDFNTQRALHDALIAAPVAP
ncbi:hypothetical protein IP90_01646 [Luteimonas cucumeris]|uniref:Uncharacterized protein n=1 Tax=Luteimonas cucumeris TaxID=985012 RepID=A0A562L855_9GAMM|nr:hypothetical protein [Luteimonas cucumeris]TWI03830.1 hypothetical protein IP90_01646 [Luteimonas cucumeris]